MTAIATAIKIKVLKNPEPRDSLRELFFSSSIIPP